MPVAVAPAPRSSRPRRPSSLRRVLALVSGLALALGLLAGMPRDAHAATQLPIREIQGTGTATPYAGKQVTTTPSVVTAVYGADSAGLRGFVIQTPGTGGPARNRTASDAVFVFMGSQAYDVRVGDAVVVTGTAGEFNGLTQIGGTVTVTKTTQRLKPIRPVTGNWASTVAAREALESMLYLSREPFLIADTFPLSRFGELALSAGRLPIQPTEVGAPGTAAHQRQTELNAATRVQLDDGTNRGYTQTATLPGRQLPYLTRDRKLTVGDTLTLTEPVIIDWRNNAWKFNPTTPVVPGDEPATVRAAKADRTPAVGGDVSVAMFNVLNYFTTVGQGRTGCTGETPSADGTFNVTFDCDVRGAWDAADLKRQEAKIVTAINALDASVVGLMEIENSAKLGEPADEATATLVRALNTAAGYRKWDYVRSNAAQLPALADQDVISNAMIYQLAEARPTGSWALGAQAGAGKPFANARTPIAASFTALKDGTATGSPMVVVVNHFKSKSASGATGDNVDRGQGAYNGDRVRQAQALRAWVPTLQQQARTDAVVLGGDFNAYTEEDPLGVLYQGGFRNAASGNEYSYVFSGLSGSLDHLLVNAAARQRMTKGDIWRINAQIADEFEYANYRTTATDYYTPDALRSSDHNPVIAGFRAGKDTGETTLRLLNFNDFHGRIAASSPNTVGFFGTIEQQREQAGEDNTLLLSAGDSIGGSLFASSSQQDLPTIEILNAAGLATSAVGNHEFDRGYPDLTGRVAQAADWDYLGANVYRKGTTTPALKEYATFTTAGVRVAVIGAVTADTKSLVAADGITDIDFGDPVDAVNRVAARLSDGNEANGEADVILAEYHDGANQGQADSTLAAQIAASPAFAKIVNQTSAQVDAIFTAHTHQTYAWDGPVPGQAGRTRPVIQSGSYAAQLGQVDLRVNLRTDQVVSYSAANLAPTLTPNAELINTYPRVKEVSDIVTETLERAEEIGSEVIGSTSGPITRARTSTGAEDRGAESTISNLVATMLRDQLSDPSRGGAQIGVQNAGGNRADLDAGDITYGEAAGVLPFANTLYTASMTGAQFKALLEQQWQQTEAGAPIGGSRPVLWLGLSDNVSFSYDATRPLNDRITSISVDGAPVDPAATYRVATPSFLVTGGDNFHAFKQATDKRDSGLVDLEAWVDYVRDQSPITPSYAKRGITVTGLPATVTPGQQVTLQVSGLDFTSPNPPPVRTTRVSVTGAATGEATATSGAATVTVTVAADATGTSTLTVGTDTGTAVVIPVTVG